MAPHPKSILYRVPGRYKDGLDGVIVTRTPTHQHHTASATYLGGRVMAVRSTEIDINVFEGGTRRTLTCARSFAPSVIVNDAVCVRVTGGGISTYEIAEVLPSTFVP